MVSPAVVGKLCEEQEKELREQRLLGQNEGQLLGSPRLWEGE